MFFTEVLIFCPILLNFLSSGTAFEVRLFKNVNFTGYTTTTRSSERDCLNVDNFDICPTKERSAKLVQGECVCLCSKLCGNRGSNTCIQLTTHANPPGVENHNFNIRIRSIKKCYTSRENWEQVPPIDYDTESRDVREEGRYCY